MQSVLLNSRIFTGDELLDNHAVIIDGGLINAIVPQNELSIDNKNCIDLEQNYLVPGFIDLQVNGGGGVMFNSLQTVEALNIIGSAHRKYGTTGFMPTLITDNYNVMRSAVAVVDDAISKKSPGVLGIHLEGPFLNAQKKGAHDSSKFCELDEHGLEIVTSLRHGKALITIAPELTTAEMISRIVAEGVIVSCGHSNANYDQARHANVAGACGFTHLFNAMTPLQSRDPGMVGAALEDDDTWFGIIADGHHSHPASFKAAVRAKARGGAVLVTDAMASVGSKDKFFELNGERIQAMNGRCVNAEGSLAGSDLDMISAIKNTIAFADIDWLEAIRMASLYPAKALGLDGELGRIAPGYRANLVALSHDLDVVETWIDGETSDSSFVNR